MNNTGAVGALSRHACADGSEPVTVCVLFIRYQLESCDTMEVDHRAHDCLNIAEQMDEQSLREKLPQTVYVERVFRRSIHPACFGSGSRTAGLEPTPVKLQFD